MKKTAFVYDDVYLGHVTPKWHPESPARLEVIMSAMKNSAVWESIVHIPPRKADFDDLGWVHTKQHIEKIRKSPEGYLDPDTYKSEGSLDASLYAAGALLECIDRCSRGELQRAFCAVRPPGHHAEADRAMGFCLFNNVAVAARYAQRQGYDKVFVIDFDVHHGNGTQHMFDTDPSIYYFSTHQSYHYPGTGSENERGTGDGAGYTYNVPMHPGSGNKEYMDIYQTVLPGLMDGFGPDIILVSAGYDILTEDPLSQIRVSNEGIRAITHAIAYGRDIPVLFILEGGYALNAIGRAVVTTVEELQKG